MVARSDSANATDLSCFLPAAGEPETELALTLQVVSLLVELSREHHIAIEPSDKVRGDTCSLRVD